MEVTMTILDDLLGSRIMDGDCYGWMDREVRWTGGYIKAGQDHTWTNGSELS